MPRFFFDIVEGDRTFHDDEGLDLPDVARAMSEARVTLPAMALEAPPGCDSWVVRSSVRNEIGEVLFEATLKLQLRQFHA